MPRINYNRGMDISSLINAVTGQFGALCLACVVLWNLMQSLKQYMEKLTEPGATKMWDGWFTVHWVPIIMDMARRQNHNAKSANTYNIAVKAAEKIRNVIKQGLYEMWKVRNDIK